MSIFLTVGILFVYFNLLFIVAQLLKDNSIVDIFWGLNYILLGVLALSFSGDTSTHNLLLLTLVSIWGLRLFLYTFIRSRGEGEDPRYQAFRKAWGSKQALGAYFQVFVVQFIVVTIIGYPIYYSILDANQPELTFTSYLGIVIFVIGLLFESIGDWQLYQFRKDPKNGGKIMRQGLWKYTRHPNYFGEAMVWLGIYLVTVYNFTSSWQFVISPLLVFLLVRFVSGVPILEKRHESTGKEGWTEYKQKTSTFFPMPPK